MAGPPAAALGAAGRAPHAMMPAACESAAPVQRAGARARTQWTVPWVLVCAAVIACGLWSARSTLPWIVCAGPASIKVDLDCDWLTGAVARQESFGQTLKWWAGPWCYERIPYYRPLTSLFFWWEYRAFGPDGLRWFTLVHLLSHLLTVSLVLGLLVEVMGRARGALAAGLFALAAPRGFGLGNIESAFPAWKDSCDLWCAASVAGSLWCFARALRLGSRRLLVASLSLFVMALTFKEMAYVTPVLAALTAWRLGRLGVDRRWVAAFFALAAAALLFRLWALGGMGYHYSTNGAWHHRLLLLAVGPPARAAANLDLLPLSLVLVIAGVVLGMAGRRLGALVAAALGAAGTVASATLLGIPVTDLLFRLLMPEVWAEAAHVGLFGLLALRHVARRDRDQTWAYLWVLAALAPLARMPIGEHGLYLATVGWGVWLAVAGLDVAESAARMARQASAGMHGRAEA